MNSFHKWKTGKGYTHPKDITIFVIIRDVFYTNHFDGITKSGSGISNQLNTILNINNDDYNYSHKGHLDQVISCARTAPPINLPPSPSTLQLGTLQVYHVV